MSKQKKLDRLWTKRTHRRFVVVPLIDRLIAWLEALPESSNARKGGDL